MMLGYRPAAAAANTAHPSMGASLHLRRRHTHTQDAVLVMSRAPQSSDLLASLHLPCQDKRPVADVRMNLKPQLRARSTTLSKEGDSACVRSRVLREELTVARIALQQLHNSPAITMVSGLQPCLSIVSKISFEPNATLSINALQRQQLGRGGARCCGAGQPGPGRDRHAGMYAETTVMIMCASSHEGESSALRTPEHMRPAMLECQPNNAPTRQRVSVWSPVTLVSPQGTPSSRLAQVSKHKAWV